MKIYWRTFKKHRSKDEDKFPFGMRFYDGTMGSGKSLSMTWDAIQLKERFPDMKLISNLIIKDFPDQKNFDTIDELILLLEESQYNKHTLVIIDEALTYFAENGGIDPALMNKITQSRACRRLIFVCSQKFKRLNNRLRDFSLETVICRSLFGIFQINTVRDDTTLHWDKDEMDFVGQRKDTIIFKRHDSLYERYDTFASVHLSKGLSTTSLLAAESPPPPSSEWGKMLDSIIKERK